MPNLSESWKCLRCGWAIDLPCEEEDPDLYHELIGCIRSHRLGHISEEGTARKLEGLLSASAEEVWRECGNEGTPLNFDHLADALSHVKQDTTWDSTIQRAEHMGAQREPVWEADVAPVLAGVEKLLRDDLPAAKRRVRWLDR